MNKKQKIILSLITTFAVVIAPLLSKSKSSNTEKIILTSDNLIVLNDEINGETVASVIAKAKSLDSGMLSGLGLKKKDPIYLYLRTPGGDIQAGIEMIEALKGLDRPVHTITVFSASMGFQTVQQLGKRYILNNGALMSHRARGGFSGEFGGQKPSQIDSRKNFWEQRINEMDQTTVSRTKGKQTLESYQKAYVSELWLTGSQAVEQGYADSVVNVQCDSSLRGVTTHELNYLGLINIQYDLDNCPLNSTPMNVRARDIETNKGPMSLEDFKKAQGGFGSYCFTEMSKDQNKVCALNPVLSFEKIDQLKKEFKENYTDIKNRIIDLKF